MSFLVAFIAKDPPVIANACAAGKVNRAKVNTVDRGMTLFLAIKYHIV